jgi:hypothetical protein
VSRPRFLTDEDLDGQIVAAIRRLEPTIDLLTVVEAEESGASDAEVLDLAQAEDRLLISHDRKTMRPTAEEQIANGAAITGLFLVRRDKPMKAVVEDVLLIWAASEAEGWRDHIVFLPL